MAKILVIDDQEGMRRSLAILLRKEGYDLEEAENGERAIAYLDVHDFDLVITDMKMSPGTGLEVLYYLREKHPDIAVIIMTGYGTVDSAVLAMKMGAFDYISKPFKNEEILHRVRRALAQRETKRDLLDEKSRTDETDTPILGTGSKMSEVVALVRKIAQFDMPVLVTGETGTGKNLIARTIHSLGKRADRPFISINCAAVPEHLLESELFGHTKGAFTGAFIERKGLFEAADSGTLLLDEIGSMPVTMQTKLLDVLQERSIRRIGSNASKPIDVRIIALTNIDLEQAVKRGTFRDDLYYRIKVAHIHVPPLREHLEDIPALCEHFLTIVRRDFGRPELRLADGARAFLRHYNYPGNIRELSNIITSAAAVSQGPEITADDVSLTFTRSIFDVPSLPGENTQARTMEEWEKGLIADCVRKHSRNLTKVCIELGIGRTTLWRKMKKYGIE